MKKILITGANSYIGNSFEKWLRQWPEDYSVETVDMLVNDWRNMSFSCYDVVLHLAGIVHRKENPNMEQMYYDVNCNLAVEVAKKAKENGVGQFVFMSTKGVYTPNTPLITSDTLPCPTRLYGKSKLKAEQQLLPLHSKEFTVSILRPPVVYGKGCQGNYVKLSRLARKAPVFPYVENQRSMIYISNLCEFIRIIIDRKIGGLLFPQNKEYVSTKEMVCCIAEIHHKRIVFSKLLGWLVLIAMKKVGMLRTMFSDSLYDISLSTYGTFEYCKVNLK
jgi:UDP-glucose 4-epimerase